MDKFTYNKKKNEEGEPQNLNKPRSHLRWKWHIDFKTSSILFSGSLMSSSHTQKKPWKLEIPFRRRTGARRTESEPANIHCLVPTPGRQWHTHAYTPTITRIHVRHANWKECGYFTSPTVLLNSWIEIYRPERIHTLHYYWCKSLFSSQHHYSIDNPGQ